MLSSGTTYCELNLDKTALHLIRTSALRGRGSRDEIFQCWRGRAYAPSWRHGASAAAGCLQRNPCQVAAAAVTGRHALCARPAAVAASRGRRSTSPRPHWRSARCTTVARRSLSPAEPVAAPCIPPSLAATAAGGRGCRRTTSPREGLRRPPASRPPYFPVHPAPVRARRPGCCASIQEVRLDHRELFWLASRVCYLCCSEEVSTGAYPMLTHPDLPMSSAFTSLVAGFAFGISSLLSRTDVKFQFCAFAHAGVPSVRLCYYAPGGATSTSVRHTWTRWWYECETTEQGIQGPRLARHGRDHFIRCG